MSEITPSQTVGPFFAYGLAPHSRCDWKPNEDYDWKDTFGADLVTPDASGARIRIEGRVFDGDGAPINDAMVEIWQADAQGRYANPRDARARTNALFKGFGRSATGKDGAYSFDTVKPGSVPGPGGKPQAPHIVVCIFSRGMLRQIYTRLYFSDEAANGDDPILALVPAARRDTLIAHKQSGTGPGVYRFDIRVQGDNETVFFDI
ncbi:MAG: protocatechuate 3,4-dioxygenase subunit alpha [Pseudolabrys sp.]